MELRPRRAFLVVADAAVDQDRVMPGAHDKAVKAEDQFAGRRIEQAWTQERGVGAHHLGVEIGKERGRVEKRTLVIGDARDLEIADADGLHLSSLAEMDLDCSALRPAIPSAITLAGHCEPPGR